MNALSSLVGAVLMIGHSLIGPHQPTMLDQMLTARGIDAPVSSQIINGAPLHYNWDHGFLAEGVDARERLAVGDVTHVVLTEALPLDVHMQWSDPAGTILQYLDAAYEANPDAQVFLQETWHDRRSGTADAPTDADPGANVDWRTRLDDDLPKWQSIVDDVNSRRPDNSKPVRLLPVGQAFAALDDAARAGQVPGLPNLDPLFPDHIHLSNAGHYFAALVQFAVITGQSPEGLPTRINDRWGQPYKTPPPETAAAMQRIVAQVVGTRAPPSDTARALPDSIDTGIPPLDPAGPPAKIAVALNLAPLADWGTQAPLLDLMKTARPWIGHFPGKWAGWDEVDFIAAGILDENGWPTRIPDEVESVGTLIMTDLPEDAADFAGTYVLTFDGSGIVELGGRAKNVRYTTNRALFDFKPGDGGVDIRIKRARGAAPDDYVRNIRVVRADREAALNAGEVFNPEWLDHVRGFVGVRFMDWMGTNNSTISTWSQRPRPEHYTYAGRGMPLELMLRLVEEAEVDPWFNIPHMADDDYVRRFAEMVHDRLPEGRRAYVEYSNEVWNWQFQQAAWADEQARKRWGVGDAWVQYYALRAAQVASIFSETFGADARWQLTNVISTQTGWRGLEEAILTAPLHVSEDPANNVPPAFYFDAYAITGYFGGLMGSEDGIDRTREWISQSRKAAEDAADARGLTGGPRRAFIDRHRYDQAIARAARDVLTGAERGSPRNTIGRVANGAFRYHSEVAKNWGLDLIVYEGGTHILGLGSLVNDDELTDFLIAFNYSPQMGTIYEHLLKRWEETGGGLFAAFNDVMAPTKWGSWGNLRYLSDDTGRWRALRAAAEAYRAR